MLCGRLEKVVFLMSNENKLISNPNKENEVLPRNRITKHKGILMSNQKRKKKMPPRSYITSKDFNTADDKIKAQKEANKKHRREKVITKSIQFHKVHDEELIKALNGYKNPFNALVKDLLRQYFKIN